MVMQQKTAAQIPAVNCHPQIRRPVYPRLMNLISPTLLVTCSGLPAAEITQLSNLRHFKHRRPWRIYIPGKIGQIGVPSTSMGELAYYEATLA